MKNNELFIAESTECEFKVTVEFSKPKSWLKTVSAFANGLGGNIYFGVNDQREIIGLEDIQKDSERISNFIKTKIDPIINFDLKPLTIENKNLLQLNEMSGLMTPYYYVNEGTRTAFVRIGNESVTAPAYLLNELVLKGQRTSFDYLSTNIKLNDASFTLFKATYKKANNKAIGVLRDFISFGMVNNQECLTYAGELLSDDCALLQSRVFCTRWMGQSKGRVSLDALDDKEYNGNIIMLLRDAVAFVKNNSKKRWKIEGINRTEYIDYPEDAVREAIVNALVHRDYSIIGSEIHIDMYEDRLEIVSPGGMYDGRKIQDISLSQVASIRRNPILADIFNRLDFMERRGSGLRRIIEAYSEPNLVTFFSDQHNFYVILRKQHEGIKLQDEEIKLQDQSIKLQDGTRELQDEHFLKEEILNIFNGKIQDKTLAYIIKLYKSVETRESFNRQDIGKIIGVSPDRASQLIKMLLYGKIIEKVVGKGLYKFCSH